jgi:uncharacterized protein YbjT (DUF2867 family)
VILITGATGTVGSHLLPLLVRRGASLRAVARSPSGRSKIEGLGVEAIDGDFDHPDSLERAMEGCDRVFLLSPTHLEMPTREKAAIDAARRAGVRHIVKLSTVGADSDSPCDLLTRHAEVEAHLTASGLDYTILRPACYMDLHLLPVRTVKASGVWYGMTGDGAHAYIDTEDVASVAAAVLTTPGHEGRTYELNGPQAITMPEAAAQLSEVLDSPVSYVDLSAAEFGSSLIGAGLPEWLVDGIVTLYQLVREGHLATVTHFVEELTGRPGRAYGEFAQAHKGAFTAA